MGDDDSIEISGWPCDNHSCTQPDYYRYHTGEEYDCRQCSNWQAEKE